MRNMLRGNACGQLHRSPAMSVHLSQAVSCCSFSFLQPADFTRKGAVLGWKENDAKGSAARRKVLRWTRMVVDLLWYCASIPLDGPLYCYRRWTVVLVIRSNSFSISPLPVVIETLLYFINIYLTQIEY